MSDLGAEEERRWEGGREGGVGSPQHGLHLMERSIVNELMSDFYELLGPLKTASGHGKNFHHLKSMMINRDRDINHVSHGINHKIIKFPPNNQNPSFYFCDSFQLSHL